VRHALRYLHGALTYIIPTQYRCLEANTTLGVIPWIIADGCCRDGCPRISEEEWSEMTKKEKKRISVLERKVENMSLMISASLETLKLISPLDYPVFLRDLAQVSNTLLRVRDLAQDVQLEAMNIADTLTGCPFSVVPGWKIARPGKIRQL
jgi:hypothetical protein